MSCFYPLIFCIFVFIVQQAFFPLTCSYSCRPKKKEGEQFTKLDAACVPGGFQMSGSVFFVVRLKRNWYNTHITFSYYKKHFDIYILVGCRCKQKDKIESRLIF